MTKKQISFRITGDLRNKIKKIAEEENRTLSQVGSFLLEKALDTADYETAAEKIDKRIEDINKKQLYDKIEEIEHLLRYYNLEGDDSGNLVRIYTEAIGQMGEAHALISELMDKIKSDN